jgi:predicted protein tyrosine phosphatase
LTAGGERTTNQRMPTLHICPLHDLDHVLATTRASHLVSLLTKGTPANCPGSISSANHLAISVSDIVEPLEGHILADLEHVAPMIDFAHAWPREAPMVIHCWAGISRSTAAAFVTACALAPHRDEMSIALALRAASPMATPNRRIVEIADGLLVREGRMVEAIRFIGRGAEASCGIPFIMPVD